LNESLSKQLKTVSLERGSLFVKLEAADRRTELSEHTREDVEARNIIVVEEAAEAYATAQASEEVALALRDELGAAQQVIRTLQEQLHTQQLAREQHLLAIERLQQALSDEQTRRADAERRARLELLSRSQAKHACTRQSATDSEVR
jgi:hypothetical protein